MGKLAIVVMLIALVVAMPIVQSNKEMAEELDEWYHKTRHAKEKVSRFHFYFHDVVSGKTPSAVTVAKASITDKSPTLFGRVFVIDDPLTEGPDPTSQEVGRAQGLYAASSQMEISLLMALTFKFTTGKYNGSSLTILGRNPGQDLIRELPIVGGSGHFRGARGLAMLRTHFINITTFDAIVEYNVLAIHY